MDDEIETMVVAVRADTAGFRRDVAGLREAIDGPLGAGAERAGRAIEGALLRAVRSGKLGFDDLKGVALAAMGEIAAAALRTGLQSVLGGARGGGGGLAGALIGLLGAPGRATGGGVAPGRPYWVGERGPELFVPTAAGRVEAGAPSSARGVELAITINAPAGSAPAALGRSGRQVARAVRAALIEAED